MTTRQERVRELVKTEVSKILQMEIKDPRLGFVTVTDAEVSKDLGHAKIFVSVFGDDEQKRKSMTALESAASYVRGELGRRVTMKAIPEISFHLDTSIDHGARIFELLRQIEHESEE